MLKMTIDNEEVVSKNNFTIKEEMLSPSSTILNNTYPKSWEQDHDYTSRFYYPKDYAKLDIQNFSITPEEAGTTIQVNGSATLSDVNTTKESRVLSLKGQTSQTGTPTPSSPIPVNVVSGDNYINICGKNLYKGDATAGTISQTDGKTISSSSSAKYTPSYIPIEANTTYTFSCNAAGIGVRVFYYDNNKTYISNSVYYGTVSTNKYVSFTTIQNVRYIRFQAGNNYVDNLMLETGNQATTYEPYIGNSYPIYLGVENLFNYSYSNLKNINRCTTSQVDNGFTLTSTGASGFGFASLEIDTTLLGKEITISMKSSGKNPSGRLFYHNSSGGLTSAVDSFWTTNNAYTITLPSTLPSGSTGIALVLYISQTNNTSGEYATFSDIQIEKGSKSNSYSAYGTTPIELCKIGTYQDYIYKDNGSWYLHKEIGKVVLDGTEVNWQAQGTGGNNVYMYQWSRGPQDKRDVVNAPIYCNYFTQITIAQSDAKNVEGIANGLKNGYSIKIGTTASTTLDGFKTWLGTNKPVVYYQLETPTTTLITDTTLLEQLDALESQ